MRKLLFCSVLALLAVPKVSSAAIVINEIMYDPVGNDNDSNTEWVELYNTDSTPVNLEGYTVKAGSFDLFTFPAGATIAGNGYVVLQFWAPEEFSADYKGGVDPAIVYRLTAGTVGSKLGNGAAGATITVRDAADNVVNAVNYRREAPWPKPWFGEASSPNPGANNTGLTIELVDPLADNTDGNNWRVSLAPSGTPGKWNSAAGTWYTDSVRNIQFPKPADTVTISIKPESTKTITSVQGFVAQGTGSTTYTPVPMTEAGGTWTGTLGNFPDKTLVKYYIEITDSDGGKAFFPSLAPRLPQAFMVANQMPTTSEIVINEIMVNPQGTDNRTNSEYIEFYNPTSNDIDLSYYVVGRLFTDMYWNRISEGTILSAGGYVVVAGRGELLSGIPSSVPVVDFMWPDGVSVLANGGTTLFVASPNALTWNDLWTALNVTPLHHLDIKSNADGWPTIADGRSLELTNPANDPNVGASWANSLEVHGTPGLPNSTASVSDWSVY